MHKSGGAGAVIRRRGWIPFVQVTARPVRISQAPELIRAGPRQGRLNESTAASRTMEAGAAVLDVITGGDPPAGQRWARNCLREPKRRAGNHLSIQGRAYRRSAFWRTFLLQYGVKAWSRSAHLASGWRSARSSLRYSRNRLSAAASGCVF